MKPAPIGPAQRWPDKFELLDGFRGIAAAGVVLHHLHVADIGHYCVMMFFVISGYCITASAASGIAKGVSTQTFLCNRFRRIYPPYALAVLFFALTRLARHQLTGETWTPSPAVWLQNLTLTQWLTLVAHPMPEAPQNPALFVAAFWSLGYEVQFYLVVALGMALAKRVGTPLIHWLGALTLVGMAINLSNPALAARGFFIEYWAHFGFGAGLYFLLCGADEFRRPALALLVLVAVLAICGLQYAMAPAAGIAAVHKVFGEYLVSLASVFVLFLLRPYSAGVARSWLWRPVSAIGAISYSLYLVHQFNLTLVARVAAAILPPASSANLALQFGLHLLVAAIFWACCEKPFQRSSVGGPPHRSPGKEPVER